MALRLGEAWTALGLLLFMPDLKVSRRQAQTLDFHVLSPYEHRPEEVLLSYAYCSCRMRHCNALQ